MDEVGISKKGAFWLLFFLKELENALHKARDV